MTDFHFFILLAVVFIALEIIAAFGVLDDHGQSDPAPGDS